MIPSDTLVLPNFQPSSYKLSVAPSLEQENLKTEYIGLTYVESEIAEQYKEHFEILWLIFLNITGVNKQKND